MTVRKVLPVVLAALAMLVAGGCEEEGATNGLIGVFGRTGMGPGEFSYPRAAVRGAGGDFFVVDKTARIQRFTPEGEFVLAWQMPESKAGKPTGLGVDAEGRIYAADTHYSRVVVFTPEGEIVGMFGSRGRGPGQFVMPTDVAVDAAGNIYVGEYGGNDRISKFSPEWDYIESIGGPESGESLLRRPQSLLIDDDGMLWVADACNHRICCFDTEGRLRLAFGRNGTGPGDLHFPYGIELMADGTLVVSEYGNNRLQRFDRSGRPLGIWGAAGRDVGQLAYPWAVVSGDAGRLYVLDSGNNRVQVIDGSRSEIWTVAEDSQ